MQYNQFESRTGAAARGLIVAKRLIAINKHNERLNNVHAGEVLLIEFIKPSGLSLEKLSYSTAISVASLKLLCEGKMDIDTDIANKLAGYFDNYAAFWLGLQRDYDCHQ